MKVTCEEAQLGDLFQTGGGAPATASPASSAEITTAIAQVLYYLAEGATIPSRTYSTTRGR